MSAKERDSFKSSLGVILALIGSAIGLGNLWRFPYLVGTNGGAAFIIIYLVCIVFLCMPIMVGEFVIGRRSQANVFGAFKKLSSGSGWKHTGALAVLTCITLLSFYVVVGGWTIDYFVKSLRMVFTPQTDFAAEFNNMVSSTGEILSFTVLFLVINGVVILAGVRKGIERTNKYLMSMLAVLIVLIAVYSLTLPGAKQGLDFLFKPDFSKVNFDTALNALGQGFLSLSIGCGSIITYASYTRKETNLLKTTTITTLSDTAFAIIAGIAILPAVFSAGMSPSEGAGLAFVSLPYVFANMPMGKII
ncbi:MAG: sodium-dependent transporter, partial [Bacteroidales bacterium]|nr:sodium-dependent transporter [Bacteroidales bacterium]